MREISAALIESTIKNAYIEANVVLPVDVRTRLQSSAASTPDAREQDILCSMLRNAEAACDGRLAICQDTGMAVVFAEVGQEVHITGDFEQAVHNGIAAACRDGYLRASVVRDPLRRVNTGNNTPAMLHTRLVPGDRIRFTVAPKGFGSENMSRVKMFTPAAGREEIISFVVETMLAAGSNPCPPVVIGVGIGGNFEGCALLAKKALCRSLDKPNDDEFYARLEQDLLAAVNATGIGAQGFGGTVTALGVNVEYAPTHIAGLPVAVNMGCHVNRHVSCEL